MTPSPSLDYAELYRVLAESATDAIVTIDAQGTMITVNGAAERLFGYPAGEMIGQPISMLVPERLREAHARGMARYVETGTRRVDWSGIRMPVLTKAGTEVPTGISFGEFTTNGQRMFSGIFRDLTAVHEAEAAMAAASMQMQEQAQELELQAEEAQVLTEELEQTNEELRITLEASEAAQHRAEFLADAAQKLASSLDYGRTIGAVVRAAVPTLGDWCAVDLVTDPESDAWPPTVERIAIHHLDPAKLELARRLEQQYQRDWEKDTGIVGVLRTGEPLFAPDVLPELIAGVARDETHRALLESLDLSSVIVVPLEAHGRRLGVLTLAATGSHRRYEQADLTLARELAARAAMAVDHARLYREAVDARHRAERAADRTMRLQAATAALAEATTRPMVGQAVLAEGLRALGARDGLLCCLTEDGEQLEIVHSVGLEDDTLAEYARFPVDAPLPLSEAVRTRCPVFLESRAELTEHFPALSEAAGSAEAWASLPLVVNDRILGAIAWGFADSRGFSPGDRALAETLAAQCAQALERVRLLHAERISRKAAEQANRAKSEFLAKMSHELRTPLNAISGHTQLLELGIHGDLTPAQRDALERVQRSQGHLLSLINDVLNYAKIEAGKIEYRIDAVPIKGIIARLEDMVLPQLRARKLHYTVAACDADPVVRADADKLQQVLLNLLSNAMKFTPEHGRVTVRCAEDGDQVKVTVEDSGIGIAEDRIADAFEPFVQVDRTLTSNHEGTGLGLAISRDLARAMGGELTATSRLGEGSIFTLTLPHA